VLGSLIRLLLPALPLFSIYILIQYTKYLNCPCFFLIVPYFFFPSSFPFPCAVPSFSRNLCSWRSLHRQGGSRIPGERRRRYPLLCSSGDGLLSSGDEDRLSLASGVFCFCSPTARSWNRSHQRSLQAAVCCLSLPCVFLFWLFIMTCWSNWSLFVCWWLSA